MIVNAQAIGIYTSIESINYPLLLLLADDSYYLQTILTCMLVLLLGNYSGFLFKEKFWLIVGNMSYINPLHLKRKLALKLV